MRSVGLRFRAMADRVVPFRAITVEALKAPADVGREAFPGGGSHTQSPANGEEEPTTTSYSALAAGPPSSAGSSDPCLAH